MLADPTQALLLYFIMPLWFLAGLADWLCHRATDIEHTTGTKETLLHLLSVVSPIADDLALVFEPLCPVPLLEALEDRGIRRLHCDPDELELQGCNVLAVRPGVVVMPKGMWLEQLPGGLTANALVPNSIDPLAGGACFNDARVEVAPLAG